MSDSIPRRGFIKAGVGAAIGVAACSTETGDAAKPGGPNAPGTTAPGPDPNPAVATLENGPLPLASGDSKGIPLRTLGKTGVKVTMFSLGGQAALQTDRKDDAVAIIQRAVDLGVTYMDTAWVYGPSLDYYGAALVDGRRDKVFIASKTFERTRDAAAKQIDDSLKRLGTNRIDLLQLHDVQTTADLDLIFAPGGAMKALEEAKADGRIRFIGITGHFDPNALEEALGRYPFDTVLMAFNAADRYRRPFRATLLPEAVKKNVGIIAMKTTGAGGLIRGPGRIRVDEALGWVWSYPVSTTIVGCDSIADLEANVAFAKAFVRYTPAVLNDIAGRVEPLVPSSSYFKRA